MTEKIRSDDVIQGALDEGSRQMKGERRSGETPLPHFYAANNERAGTPDAGPLRGGKAVSLRIDGGAFIGQDGELLVDAINRAQIQLAQVCYHPQLGPIQTCDTCIGGGGRRAGAGPAAPWSQAGLTVTHPDQAARTAQREAYGPDRGQPRPVLHRLRQQQRQLHGSQHAGLLGISTRPRPFQPKGLPQEDSNSPFYRYDPDQCILCGRCVEACQNVQVNETLSINWEAEHPRVLWDGGKPIGESQLRESAATASRCAPATR